MPTENTTPLVEPTEGREESPSLPAASAVTTTKRRRRKAAEKTVPVTPTEAVSAELEALVETAAAPAPDDAEAASVEPEVIHDEPLPTVPPELKPEDLVPADGFGPGTYLCVRDCQGSVRYVAGERYYFQANPAPSHFTRISD